jgi:hypothetical protein
MGSHVAGVADRALKTFDAEIIHRHTVRASPSDLDRAFPVGEL